MKIFMTGGTGFVGSALTHKFTGLNHEVTVLTRSSSGAGALPPGASFVEGDPMQAGDWQERAGEHDVFVNLAGASIFKRWTDRYKALLRDSRIHTTRNLVDALSGRPRKATLLLSASAVGYYGFHADEELDERSPPGGDFLASLSQEWENEAARAAEFGVRVVLCRFGIVLGKGGGALKQMTPVFRLGLGSPLGSGAQWFSWIHLDDLTDAFTFLMGEEGIAGPVNLTAPHPVTNGELTKSLSQALGKPAFLPGVPGFLIELAMGEFGSVLLQGQRVRPKRLLENGFRFRYPGIEEALRSLLG